MATFGFKLAVMEITPNYKPNEPFELNDSVFGAGGALTRVGDALAEARRLGEDDQKAATYSEILDSTRIGRGVCVLARQGGYGTRRETVDRRTGDNGPTLSPDQAVLHESRLVFIVPDTGAQAIVVSEVRGRSHATGSVVKQLARQLKSEGMVPRLRQDVADGIAWTNFLDSAESGIVGVELTSKTRDEDGMRLVDGAGVESVNLHLGIDPGSSTATTILGELRDRFINPEHKVRRRINLARVVGVTGYREDETARGFDDERVIVVENGRRRTINVSRGFPSFVYPIDTEEEPTDTEFEQAVIPVVSELIDDLDIELPPGWWPSF